MSGWHTSDRRSRLPGNWQALRLRVLRRDRYLCQARDSAGLKCNAPAKDVDHVIPNDDHAMTNLQSLCIPCHKAKTSNEAREARADKANRGRYTEPHPGMIEPTSSS